MTETTKTTTQRNTGRILDKRICEFTSDVEIVRAVTMYDAARRMEAVERKKRMVEDAAKIPDKQGVLL